jgi:uncharacterized protein
LSLSQLLVVAIAGVVAGAINSIAGAGSLLTFPALLAVGLPPLQANVTNSIGLVPGSMSGAWGYRRELRGQERRLALLMVPMAIGAVAGALLLLVLPPRVFEVVVPVLVALSSVLVLLQPSIARRLKAPGSSPVALTLGLLLVGVYGGYFGAAQGIMLLAVLGLFVSGTLQRLNGFKMLIAGCGNTVAGIIFVLVAHVAWPYAVVIAAASVVGGLIGAHLSRRLPDRPLRLAIAVFGLGVAGLLAFRQHLI